MSAHETDPSAEGARGSRRAAHPKCTRPDGHTCQRPSGRVCIERGCDEKAGTLWGPLWCPEHDADRLNRISASLEGLLR